jgi:outer membrane usher protein
VAPFFINGLQQGQIIVFVSLGGSSSLQITASTLLAKMEEYARPDIQTRLQAFSVRDKNYKTLTEQGF